MRSTQIKAHATGLSVISDIKPRSKVISDCYLYFNDRSMTVVMQETVLWEAEIPCVFEAISFSEALHFDSFDALRKVADIFDEADFYFDGASLVFSQGSRQYSLAVSGVCKIPAFKYSFTDYARVGHISPDVCSLSKIKLIDSTQDIEDVISFRGCMVSKASTCNLNVLWVRDQSWDSSLVSRVYPDGLHMDSALLDVFSGGFILIKKDSVCLCNSNETLNVFFDSIKFDPKKVFGVNPSVVLDRFKDLFNGNDFVFKVDTAAFVRLADLASKLYPGKASLIECSSIPDGFSVVFSDTFTRCTDHLSAVHSFASQTSFCFDAKTLQQLKHLKVDSFYFKLFKFAKDSPEATHCLIYDNPVFEDSRFVLVFTLLKQKR